MGKKQNSDKKKKNFHTTSSKQHIVQSERLLIHCLRTMSYNEVYEFSTSLHADSLESEGHFPTAACLQSLDNGFNNTVSFQFTCGADGNMTFEYFDDADCTTANSAVTYDVINSTCANSQSSYAQFLFGGNGPICNATYPAIPATEERMTYMLDYCYEEDTTSSQWVCIAGVLNSNYYDDAACTTLNRSTPLMTENKCVDMTWKGGNDEIKKLDFSDQIDPCPTSTPTGSPTSAPTTAAPVTVAPVTAAPTPEDSAFDIKHKGMFWALIIAAVSSAVAVL